MKTNLLNKKFLMVSMAAALSACGDVEEGRDFNFGSDEAVTYETATLDKEFTENSGVVEIDLFEGGISNGEMLTAESTGVLVREFLFGNAGGDPDGEPTLVPPRNVDGFSPFLQKGNKLFVQTDAFANSLHKCGEVPSHTYSISYVLDNGYTPPFGQEVAENTPRPGARTLNLTLTGTEDALTKINILDNDAPIQASVGGDTQLMAEALPVYACNKNYTWSIDDESIATINPTTGVLSGIKAGTATITITSEVGALVDTATVEVKNAPIGVGSIAIENSAMKKEVPACTTASFNVIPSPKAGETLSGTFVYTWTTDADQFTFANSMANADFSEKAYFRTDANEDATTDKMVSVKLSAGNVPDATATFDVVPSLVCEAIGTFDQAFESINTNVWKPMGNVTVTTTSEGISGSGYLITVDGDTAGETGINMLNFNRGNTANNVLAREFGLLRDKADNGGSWGKEFKTSMWVKVVKADNSMAADSVKLTHTILPWLSTPGGDRGPKRALSPEFVATVTPGEWQYVEFVDQQWDNDANTSSATFTVPTTWTHRDGPSQGATSVIPEFLFEGLAQGDQVFIDDYAVVRVDQ